MLDLFAKINAGAKHAVIGGRHWFSRLRARPENERRALFFATFLIAATLVFSFWANQMYRQFGIAFMGSPTGGPQADNLAAPVDNGENPGGLLSPLAAFKENATLLIEEAKNLFSGISASLRGEDFVSPPGAAEPDKKEPPSLLNDSEDITAVTKINKQAPVLAEDAIPAGKSSAALNKDGGESLDDKEPPMAVFVQPPDSSGAPLVVADDDGGDADGGNEIQPERGGAKEESKDADNGNGRASSAEKRKSRLVSIFKTNFAAIQQAFADFWDYLTR